MPSHMPYLRAYANTVCSPLVQWADVQDNIGSAYTQIQMALETYYKYTLNQLPGPPNGGTTYDADPSQLPSIFADGTFASEPQVGVFPDGISERWRLPPSMPCGAKIRSLSSRLPMPLTVRAPAPPARHFQS